jgi:hypothetical protein
MDGRKIGRRKSECIGMCQFERCFPPCENKTRLNKPVKLEIMEGPEWKADDTTRDPIPKQKDL